MTEEPPLSIKAIAIGALTDLAGTMLASFGLTVIWAVFLAAEGVGPEDMQQRIAEDPGYYPVTLIMGLGFVAVGGYVGGRIAQARELMHGALVGLVAMAVGVLFVLAAPPDAATWPSWYLTVSFGLTVPFGVLGGFIAQRRNTRPAR